MTTVTFPQDSQLGEVIVEVDSDDPNEIARAVFAAIVDRLPGRPEIDVILTSEGGTVFVWDDLDKVGEGKVALSSKGAGE